jgi:beta-glucanase (GH16 family)
MAIGQGATTLNGGELFSLEKVKFGRWEIRMQLAATPGSVSSFFTYYDESYLGQPEPWLEIDIEALGNKPKGFQSNLITGTAESKVTSEEFHVTEGDLSKEFHTYVLEWTPDSIVYRMDGKLLRKDLKTDQQVVDLVGKNMSYRMNLWASTATGWVGTLDPSKLPIAQTVNWMAYSAYTPGSGPGGSNFTPTWVDDFTTLNMQRWSRGDWTFESNMADFKPANIVVSGGYLMIILSNKDWSGTIPPPVDPMGNSYSPTSIRLNHSTPPSKKFQSPGSSLFRSPHLQTESGTSLVLLNGRLFLNPTF